MKRILLSLLIFCFAATISAVPSLKIWRTYTQSDGTKIELMLVGDENFHYFTTTDGVVVIEDGGGYYYADITGQYLQRSNLLAHEPKLRTVEEMAFIEQLGNNDVTNLRRIRTNAPQLTKPRQIGVPSSYVGSKRGLIILVSFDDLDFKGYDPKESWTNIANKEGYTNNFGAIGSVHDYFADQSHGLFDLSFDVVGPYKAPKSVTYYGENNSRGADSWQRVIELVKFACIAADNEVDFKDYDWDNDGEVDQIFILYAGKGEENGGESFTIWPHESQIGKNPEPYRLDNVIINTYACCEELNDNNDPSGIGNFCHEFSHCLGLPDFYDTRTNNGVVNTNYGMGTWDVMCDGSHNGNSWVPAAYTGYERNFCGWKEYKELSDSLNVSSLAPITDNGDVYCYRNPQHPDEYYLFEHRNNTVGWDRGVASKGLFIYHVNYIQERWRNNTPNNGEAGVECMAVVAADNSRSKETENGDLFPYTSTSRTYNVFSDGTDPADILYYPNTDGTKLLHIKLYDINYTDETKTVSFVFKENVEENLGPKEYQTISLSSLPLMTYGNSDYTLPSTTNEGFALTWTSSNQNVAVVSNNKLYIKGAGTSVIIASNDGNEIYKPFEKEYSLSVSKALLTITANDCEIERGDTIPILTASYSGFVYNDNVNSLIRKPDITTTATPDSPAGKYEIKVSGAQSLNYQFNYVNGTLTIIPVYSVGDTLTYKGLNYIINKIENEDKEVTLIKNPDAEGIIKIPSIITDESKMFNFEVTAIEDYAFYNCSKISSLYVPAKVRSIGVAITSCCTLLNKIIVDANNPYYDSRNNCNAIINTETGELLAGCNKTVIPEDVSAIGPEAMRGMFELENIKLPNSLTLIGNRAFYYCNKLKGRLNIPEGVIEIGTYAFYKCTNLTTISIPSTISVLGNCAFRECTNVTSVSCRAEIPPSIDSRMFGNYTSCVLSVPFDCVNKYKSANTWKNFYKIVEESKLSVADIKVQEGNKCKISINLVNRDNVYSGFQFNITLPEGIDLVKNPRGGYEYTISNRYDGQPDISINPQEDGSYMVLMYSMDNTTITGCEGEIINLEVKVNADLPINTYTGTITEITFNNPDNTSVFLQDVYFNIIVPPFDYGDVNHDRSINITDVMMTVNHVIGQTPAGFHIEDADVNGDGVVNISDIMAIVNLVINAPTTNAPIHSRESMTDTVILTKTAQGYAVALKNNEPYTALQMDIQLTEDAPLNARLSDNRSDSHSILCSDLGNGHHRIAIYSLNGNALKGNDGVLFQLLTNNNGSLPAIDNVQLTNNIFETVMLSNVTVPTDITNIDIDNLVDAPVYNTQGIRATKHEKGIIIQEGRKYVK